MVEHLTRGSLHLLPTLETRSAASQKGSKEEREKRPRKEEICPLLLSSLFPAHTQIRTSTVIGGYSSIPRLRRAPDDFSIRVFFFLLSHSAPFSTLPLSASPIYVLPTTYYYSTFFQLLVDETDIRSGIPHHFDVRAAVPGRDVDHST